MDFRDLGKTGERVGVIGMGCEGFSEKSFSECCGMVDFAIRHGINYFDMYASDPTLRKNLGGALNRYPRNSFLLQGHICSIWEDGQYLRTRDINKVKEGFGRLLEQTGLSFVDVGMIHYVDTVADFEEVFSGEIIKYCIRLKEEGLIKHIGLSTHNTEIAEKAAKSGIVEVIMFSINPAYDMLPAIDDVEAFFAEHAFDCVYEGIDPKREALYRLCQNEGVALTVMKCYAGGLLLDDAQSPFGGALTPVQCIGYALARPGVASVLCGAATLEEILDALGYCYANDEEKDFGYVLARAPKSSFSGHCMYCGHCAPCSAKIDIASVNKYLDLAEAQGTLSETVKNHYELLSHTASDCIACGLCMKNCPFGVKINERMKRANEIFGK